MRVLAFLAASVLAFPASAQVTESRLPVLCMPVSTFMAGMGKGDEKPLLHATTGGGGRMELWSDKDSHTLVYYPPDSVDVVCVVGTGDRLIPGPKGEKS